ncbi:unnamed protein product [Arctia plantaginis]|uniref:TIL domain-containing protein n=1 Tax=Arctia plantaginis TaxID=874455 RepID=A0A8S0Z3R2_ARCPL|nr:unnamed protein product [Arctia plantaginis]
MSKWVVITLVTTCWVYFIHSALICKENEVNVECAHCGPKRCEDLGYPIRCGGATSLCKPECVCIDGYVKDTNGTCIPKTECPSCRSDFNATTGCALRIAYKLLKKCKHGAEFEKVQIFMKSSK